MRPPDDLTTLKHVPVVLLCSGAFLVPALWAFVVDTHTLLMLAPVSGFVFLVFGLHLKYRSRFSPREALWSFPIALIFFGTLLVTSTTALAWRAQRADLQWLALALAFVLLFGGMLIGYLSEARRLAVTRDGIPLPLQPMLDLKRHRVLPVAAPRPPKLGTVAVLSALVLNVPLVLQAGGWSANDVVWLAMPVLGATVAYVATTGLGPALARALALRRIERQLGHAFCTSRLEELQQLRRGFWLSRWLARQDVV